MCCRTLPSPFCTFMYTHIQKTIDKVGKYIIQEYNTTGLRSLTPLALVGLFFSLLFFMAAVICRKFVYNIIVIRCVSCKFLIVTHV